MRFARILGVGFLALIFASPAIAAPRRAQVISLATIAGYASQVAGQPVTILCQGPAVFTPGENGFVDDPDGVPQPVIHLPTQTCSRLERSKITSWIDPEPWLTLTHEIEHIALLSTDECVVEKAAMANEWTVVRMFGLVSWRSRAIMAGARYADAQLTPVYHEGC